MTDTDIRAPLSATAATMTGGATPPRKQAPRPLSPQALERAAMPTAKSISPIVLAGTVRMAEFAIIVIIGMLIYAAYLPAEPGALCRYFGATVAIACLATLAFQTADIYQVQAFRGHEKQYFRLASAWSVVFLVVIGVSFFAKAGDHQKAYVESVDVEVTDESLDITFTAQTDNPEINGIEILPAP